MIIIMFKRKKNSSRILAVCLYTLSDLFILKMRRFFDAINFCKGETMDKRCNAFAYSGRNDSNWAFGNILKFLHSQKERVEKKEITASTLGNYAKTIKM